MSPTAQTAIVEATDGNAQQQGGSAVSVIIPVTQRPHDLAWLYESYSKEFIAANRHYEFVFATEPWASSLTDPLQPHSTVDSGNSIEYDGDGNSSSDWDDQPNPTIGSEKEVPIPTATGSSTWGAIKHGRDSLGGGAGAGCAIKKGPPLAHQAGAQRFWQAEYACGRATPGSPPAAPSPAPGTTPSPAR